MCTAGNLQRERRVSTEGALSDRRSRRLKLLLVERETKNGLMPRSRNQYRPTPTEPKVKHVLRQTTNSAAAGVPPRRGGILISFGRPSKSRLQIPTFRATYRQNSERGLLNQHHEKIIDIHRRGHFWESRPYVTAPQRGQELAVYVDSTSEQTSIHGDQW